MKHNDIFSYDYNSNKDVLIVKVDNIKVDGNTVTITGQKAEIDEVFDYVRIESNRNSTVDYTPPTGSIKEKSASDEKPSQNLVRRSMAFDKGGEVSKDGISLSVSIEGEKEGKNVKVSGSIEGSIEASFGASMKLYVSTSHQYIEVIFNYSLGLQLAVSGEFEVSKSLGNIVFEVVPGIVTVKVEPSIVFRVGIELDLDGTFEGKVGIEYSDGDFNKIATAEISSEIEASGYIYLGLSLEPSINVVSDRFAEVSMTAEAGVEVSAEYSKELFSASVGDDEEEPDKKHTCGNCISGKVVFKAEISFEATFLNLDWLTATYDLLDFEKKITDFYYSFTEKQFGWTKCPFVSYKTTEKIVDSDYNTVSGVNVTIINDDTGKSYKASTNNKGIAVLYLPDGDYKIKISKSGEKYVESTYRL